MPLPRRFRFPNWTPVPTWKRPRAALTLVELLLVLMLVVIAGSLAMPSIVGAYSSVRLRRAGDAVITRWSQARAEAIETGVPYQFRFTPETGTYRVEPWSATPQAASTNSAAAGAGSSSLPLSSTSTSSSSSSTSSSDVDATLAEQPTIEAQLDEPVTFQGGQLASLDPQSSQRRVDSLQSASASWSTPILFFPDGTASQATIVLQNDRQQYLRLTIRGLTGVARTSTILTREELDRGAATR